MTPTTAEKATDVIDVEEKQGPLPAKTEAANLPALVDENDPWHGVDDGDLAAPDGRAGSPFPLLQLNRKADGTGGFLDTDTGEKFFETDFIWLARATSRAWWEKDFGKGETTQPDCRSFDGVEPDKASPKLQNDVCATCPQSQFPDGGGAPKCSEAVEMMVFLPDSAGGYGRLARLRMTGLGVGPTKAFWRSFQDRLPKRPPIAFLSHVTLEEQSTDNGTFLVPRYSRVRELAFDEARPIIDERDKRIAEWKERLVADVAEGNVERAPDAGTAGSDPFPDEPAPSTQPHGHDDPDDKRGDVQQQAEYGDEPF